MKSLGLKISQFHSHQQFLTDTKLSSRSQNNLLFLVFLSNNMPTRGIEVLGLPKIDMYIRMLEYANRTFI